MKKLLAICGALVLIGALWWLFADISGKQAEKAMLSVPRGEPANEHKAEDWKPYYPKQYETWAQTKQTADYLDLLEARPKIAVIRMGEDDYGAWLGHGRGHYYQNIDMGFNLASGAMEGEEGGTASRCLVCHSGDTLRLMERDGVDNFYSKSLAHYGKEAMNPIGCVDCHDPKTGALAMKREYLNDSLRSAGLPDWEHSSHQEKRSLLCAQCHVLSYTKKYEFTDANGSKKIAKGVIFPWSKGLSVEETEAHYDDPALFGGEREVHFENTFSRAPIIFAEHPDYELFQKGVHAKNGLACADCHLPYTSEGGSKFSHHKIGNPLEMMDKVCLTCHAGKKDILTSIVKDKKAKFDRLSDVSLDNLAAAHLEAAKAWELNATQEEMKPVLDLLRKAQWRWTYVDSSFGAYFHATDESLRIFSDANDYAMQARVKLAAILASRGVRDYKAPEIKTLDDVYALVDTTARKKLIKEKCEWIDKTGRKWLAEAKANGTLFKELEGVEKAFNFYDHLCKKDK